MLTIFKEKWKKFIYLYLISFALFITYMLVHKSENSFSILVYYIDGLSIACGVMFCFGMFSLLNKYGAFDFISYAFANKNTNNGKLTFGEYIENSQIKKKQRKHDTSPYFIVSLSLFLLSGILILVLQSQMAM